MASATRISWDGVAVGEETVDEEDVGRSTLGDERKVNAQDEEALVAANGRWERGIGSERWQAYCITDSLWWSIIKVWKDPALERGDTLVLVGVWWKSSWCRRLDAGCM